MANVDNHTVKEGFGQKSSFKNKQQNERHENYKTTRTDKYVQKRLKKGVDLKYLTQRRPSSY